MIFPSNAYFRLYACCIPVKGACKSLIYDIQRRYYLEIDNIVYDLLINNSGKTIQELKDYYNNRSDIGIEKYFTFFIENELGFVTTEPGFFPDISTHWESPFHVQSAVVEYHYDMSNYNLLSVNQQLASIGCQFIQFRFNQMSVKKMKYFLSPLNESRVRGIDIVVKYDKWIDSPAVNNLIRENKRIHKVYIIGVPPSILKNDVFNNKSIVPLDSELNYSTRRLHLSFDSFFEAQRYNIGLNKKVCINKNGLFKNDLHHKKSYGNIRDMNIVNLLKSTNFTEKWSISNDEIGICEDCQFRYMCISMSDLKLKGNKFYKIESCEFDPYKK